MTHNANIKTLKVGILQRWFKS